MQELEFVKKIKEKWGIVDIGKLKKENIIIRKKEETITNLEICNMEKLEFKGQDNKEKYERKQKEKRSYINGIGQIFYEILRVKKEKKLNIEEELGNMKIKERKARKFLNLMLLYKKKEGKIIENEIEIFRKIVKGKNKK